MNVRESISLVALVGGLSGCATFSSAINRYDLYDGIESVRHEGVYSVAFRDQPNCTILFTPTELLSSSSSRPYFPGEQPVVSGPDLLYSLELQEGYCHTLPASKLQ